MSGYYNCSLILYFPDKYLSNNDNNHKYILCLKNIFYIYIYIYIERETETESSRRSLIQIIIIIIIQLGF